MGGVIGADAIATEGGDTMESMLNDPDVALAKGELEAASQFAEGYYAKIAETIRDEEGNLKTAFEEMKNVIGDKARRTSSLGRRFMKDSNFTAAYKKLIKAAIMTQNEELINQIVNLRVAVARQALQQQEYVLWGCKDSLDREWSTNTRKQVDYARDRYNKSIDVNGVVKSEEGKFSYSEEVSDIRDLDECLNGFWRGRMTRGAVLERSANRLDSDAWPCMVSGGLYSRYLCEGERAANRHLEAIAFVAGRRRSTPRRKSSSALQSTEFYRPYGDTELYGGVGPGICLTPDGTAAYTAKDMNVVDVAAGRSWMAKFCTDGEKTAMLSGKDSKTAHLLRKVCEGSANPKLLGIEEEFDFRGPLDPKTGEEFPDWEGHKKYVRRRTSGMDNPPPPENSPTVRDKRICLYGTVNTEACNAAFASGDGHPLDPGFDPDGGIPRGAPMEDVRESVAEIARTVRTKSSPGFADSGWRRKWSDNAAKTEPRNVMRQVEMDIDDEVGSGEAVNRRGRGWNRQWYTATLGQLLKFGTYAFSFYLLFNQMSHDKTGCYLRKLRSGTAEEPYFATKICPHATFPNGVFSFSANRAIEQACSCDCVYQAQGTACARSDPPNRLIKNGCSEGVSITRTCRKDQTAAGFDYRWNEYTVMDAIQDTATSLAQDLGACIDCATKLGAMALGGGIISIFAIVVILIILYVVHWVYRNFFSGIGDGGGSDFPVINIDS